MVEPDLLLLTINGFHDALNKAVININSRVDDGFKECVSKIDALTEKNSQQNLEIVQQKNEIYNAKQDLSRHKKYHKKFINAVYAIVPVVGSISVYIYTRIPIKLKEHIISMCSLK